MGQDIALQMDNPVCVCLCVYVYTHIVICVYIFVLVCVCVCAYACSYILRAHVYVYSTILNRQHTIMHVYICM